MSENNKKQAPRKPRSAKEIKARAARRQQIIRRRRMMLAAFIALVVLVVAVVICAVNGVFDRSAKTSTLTLKSNGKVIFEEVEDFSESYYDKGELKSYIKDEIKSYNKSNDGTVTLKKLKVKKQKAYAKYEFSDYKTYANFTSSEVFAGTVSSAQSAEYDFLDTFYSVKDGKKSKEASTEDVIADSDNKALIVRDNMNVVVPGEILFVSDSCTTMVDTNQISIEQPDGNDDATVLTYIVYKNKK